MRIENTAERRKRQNAAVAMDGFSGLCVDVSTEIFIKWILKSINNEKIELFQKKIYDLK